MNGIGRERIVCSGGVKAAWMEVGEIRVHPRNGRFEVGEDGVDGFLHHVNAKLLTRKKSEMK
jgi:hypothetical protein